MRFFQGIFLKSPVGIMQLFWHWITSQTASASRSAPILESTNTTMGGLKCLESWRIENKRFFLDLSSTHKTTCLTESVGALGDPTNVYTGLISSLVAMLSIDDGIVAENIKVCFLAGNLSMISWTYQTHKKKTKTKKTSKQIHNNWISDNFTHVCCKL